MAAAHISPHPVFSSVDMVKWVVYTEQRHGSPAIQP